MKKRFRLEVFTVDVQDFSGDAIYLIQLVNNVWPIKLRDPICSYIEQIKYLRAKHVSRGIEFSFKCIISPFTFRVCVQPEKPQAPLP